MKNNRESIISSLEKFKPSEELQLKINEFKNNNVFTEIEDDSFDLTKLNPEEQVSFLNFLYDFVKIDNLENLTKKIDYNIPLEIDIERMQKAIDSGFNECPHDLSSEELLEYICNDNEEDNILSKKIVDELWEKSGLSREDSDNKFKELLERFK